MRFDYHKLASHRKQLDSLLELAQLAEDCDTQVEDTFRLANHLRDSPQMQHCVERLMGEKESRKLIESRQPYVRPNPDWLASLDEGSLGHQYHQILLREKLQINYGPPASYFYDLETDADYINYRVFCTHDFYHIVSGFSLDIFGETGARTLLVAQCGYPPMALTDVVNLLTSWLANDICPGDGHDDNGELSQIYLLEVMALAVRMAKSSKPLFSVNWNELLPEPLHEVRKHLGIEPVTMGRYSWHSQYGQLLIGEKAATDAASDIANDMSIR